MKKIEYSPEIYSFQIDINQHVSNIVYIQWMEIGRLQLLKEVGLDISVLEKKGIAPVLLKTEIEYKQPLYYGDKLTVEMWIESLKRTSAVLVFDFMKEKKVHVARGRQIGVFIQRNSMRPHRLSLDEKSAFSPYKI